MFLCVISPKNPQKLVIQITKIPTREQNFPTNGLVGGGGRSAPQPPIGFGPESPKPQIWPMLTHSAVKIIRQLTRVLLCRFVIPQLFSESYFPSQNNQHHSKLEAAILFCSFTHLQATFSRKMAASSLLWC